MGCEAAPGDWKLALRRRLGAVIGHLLFVERCAGLSYDDAAEYQQRSLPMRLRQQIPQLVEIYAAAESCARGGSMIAIFLGMGHLLGPVFAEIESIQPAKADRRARLLATSSIPVKREKWG